MGTKQYDIILADPPWAYYGDKSKDQAAGKHYDLMKTDEISKIDLPLKDTGILFCWATSPKLNEAIELMSLWGLHFRGVSFVWVKTRKDGGVISGQGVRPSIVKPTTEFVLAGSKVKKGRPIPIRSESVGQVVLSPRPENRHSKKPEEIQNRIEELYGSGLDYLEMFARRKRKGWDALGDELPAT